MLLPPLWMDSVREYMYVLHIYLHIHTVFYIYISLLIKCMKNHEFNPILTQHLGLFNFLSVFELPFPIEKEGTEKASFYPSFLSPSLPLWEGLVPIILNVFIHLLACMYLISCPHGHPTITRVPSSPHSLGSYILDGTAALPYRSPFHSLSLGPDIPILCWPPSCIYPRDPTWVQHSTHQELLLPPIQMDTLFRLVPYTEMLLSPFSHDYYIVW